MAFSKEKRIQIYRKLLTKFYNGDYISKSNTDIEISKNGVTKFVKSLEGDGLIFLTTGEKGRTFINFTKQGINVLRKSFGDDLFRSR